jgi:nitrite reductase/ring-hydroxylating ferredoxin subunit
LSGAERAVIACFAVSEFVPVIDASELAPGHCREVVVAGMTLALCNVGGRFHAVGGRCGHRGGPLGQGVLDGGRLVCPWHGWAYDVASGVHESNPNERIPVLDVRVEAGRLLVEAG